MNNKKVIPWDSKSPYEKHWVRYKGSWFLNYQDTDERDLLTLTENGERKWQEDHNKEIQRQRQEYIKQLKINSLMDDRFKECTFENFEVTEDNKKYYCWLKEYALRFDEMKAKNIGLILYGQAGTGKSFMSFCIANYLLDNSRSVIACSILTLINKIREYSSFGNNYMSKFHNAIQKADLFIIDDLGAENNSEWVNSKIYEIIDLRYRSKLPLIITTNLDPDTTLKKKLTNKDGISRSYNRIYEMCSRMKVDCEPRRTRTGNRKQMQFNDLMNNRR